MTGDEKSKVGNADVLDEGIRWDFFNDKESNFKLKTPLTFKINKGRFSGTTGDYQFNGCGFLLFSDKLRSIFEKHLKDIDCPKWFPAKVIDLDGNEHNYSILYLFNKPDFLDYESSTFVDETDHPIKKRFDPDKIGERLIFNSTKFGVSLCVHDLVRKEIKKAGSTGIYFYKIYSPGRLS